MHKAFLANGNTVVKYTEYCYSWYSVVLHCPINPDVSGQTPEDMGNGTPSRGEWRRQWNKKIVKKKARSYVQILREIWILWKKRW